MKAKIKLKRFWNKLLIQYPNGIIPKNKVDKIQELEKECAREYSPEQLTKSLKKASRLLKQGRLVDSLKVIHNIMCS